MRIRRSTVPTTPLQKLRFGVLEKIRADTDIQLQGQLAKTLSMSSGMVSSVLLGRANFRLRDALKLRELCPSIGTGWVYFLTPTVHDSLTRAIEESQQVDTRALIGTLRSRQS